MISQDVRSRLVIATSPRIDLDAVGTTASLTCAVHCAVMPLVVTLLPFVGLEFLANKTTDWLIWAVIATVGLVSLGRGYRSHGNQRALMLLVAGLSLLATGHLIETSHHVWGLAAVLVGGLTVATSHLINRAWCRVCPLCASGSECSDALTPTPRRTSAKDAV